MEILYVTRPITPPWNEGSKNLTWQLASRLKRHTPYLLTKQNNQLSTTNQKIVEYPIYTESLLTLTQKIRLFSFLLFKMPPVDILHFFFVPTRLTTILLSIVCFVHKKRTIQTIPCLPTTTESDDDLKKILFANKIVVFSEYTEKRLRSANVTNITRIHAGIETKKFLEAKTDLNLFKRYGLPNDAIVLLFSGEYSRLGSIEILKNVLPKIIEKCPKCHTLIACRILKGEDIEAEKGFKQFVTINNLSKQIHFVGEVPHFSALLKTCDIFLFPVLEMNGKVDIPLSLIEAMAAGLPIVSFCIPPLDEVFTADMESIVDEGNISDMVAAIMNLARHPQKRLEQGLRNQQRIMQRYDLKKMVAKYEALYDAIH